MHDILAVLVERATIYNINMKNFAFTALQPAWDITLLVLSFAMVVCPHTIFFLPTILITENKMLRATKMYFCVINSVRILKEKYKYSTKVQSVTLDSSFTFVYFGKAC